jgi:hypothetical protein
VPVLVSNIPGLIDPVSNLRKWSFIFDGGSNFLFENWPEDINKIGLPWLWLPAFPNFFDVLPFSAEGLQDVKNLIVGQVTTVRIHLPKSFDDLFIGEVGKLKTGFFPSFNLHQPIKIVIDLTHALGRENVSNDPQDCTTGFDPCWWTSFKRGCSL